MLFYSPRQTFSNYKTKAYSKLELKPLQSNCRARSMHTSAFNEVCISLHFAELKAQPDLAYNLDPITTYLTRRLFKHVASWVAFYLIAQPFIVLARQTRRTLVRLTRCYQPHALISCLSPYISDRDRKGWVRQTCYFYFIFREYMC